jgi:beta-lactamase regulating signal transducer with metallopeptidase domain
VTVGAVLLLYALVVGKPGLSWFRRAQWPSRSPRLGIAVYVAAAWSALAAVALAGMTLAVPTTALSGGISDALGACVLRMRAEYATPGGITVAVVGIAISAAVAIRVGVATSVQVATMRKQARRQVELAQLVGRLDVDLDALVVDDDQPTAFCIGGPRPTIVFTSSAVGWLDTSQLHAVLAHERAHLTHGHHRLQTAACVLARSMPMLPLLREAPEQIGRLVEMHADDVATGAHDRSVLASALVALATAPIRQPVLAVAATDTLARMRRLLAPLPPLPRTTRRVVCGLIGVLVLLPLLTAGTPALIALALGRVTPQ